MNLLCFGQKIGDAHIISATPGPSNPLRADALIVQFEMFRVVSYHKPTPAGEWTIYLEHGSYMSDFESALYEYYRITGRKPLYV